MLIAQLCRTNLTFHSYDPKGNLSRVTASPSSKVIFSFALNGRHDDHRRQKGGDLNLKSKQREHAQI